MSLLVSFLLFINIFWGLLNLMPIYPLDGGQISREIFTMRDPYRGIPQSLWVSVFTGAGIAVWALMLGSIFMTIMFGMLAFSSYQALQGYGGGGRFGGGGGFGGGRSPW